jgi:hypothetical protein
LRRTAKTSLLLLFVVAVLLKAQTTAPSNTQSADSDALKALKDQNALLDEQIKLFTNQQTIARFYFPSIPQRLDPNFTREGVATLKGSVATYEKLRIIARNMADRIKGGNSISGPIQLTEAEACANKSGKDLSRCLDNLKVFNAAAQAKFPPLPATTPAVYGPVLIQGQQEAASIYELEGLTAQLRLLDRRVECALDPGLEQCQVRGVAATGGLPAAVFIGPALQAVVDLINFFRKKTTVSSISVDPDESAMIAMLAAALEDAKVGTKSYATRQFPPSLTAAQDSPLVAMLDTLRKRAAAIQLKIQSGEAEKQKADKASAKPEPLIVKESEVGKLESEIAHLESLRIASTEAQRTEIGRILDRRREEKRQAEVEVTKLSQSVTQAQAESKRLAAAIKQWTDLRDSINLVLAGITEQNQSDNALAEYLRAERIQAIMKEKDAVVLQVKVHVAGAEIEKTDRAGFVKETGKGGAIASYILYGAQNGQVKSSGNFTIGPS